MFFMVDWFDKVHAMWVLKGIEKELSFIEKKIAFLNKWNFDGSSAEEVYLLEERRKVLYHKVDYYEGYL